MVAGTLGVLVQSTQAYFLGEAPDIKHIWLLHVTLKVTSNQHTWQQKN
jgi:hypothetical protein